MTFMLSRLLENGQVQQIRKKKHRIKQKKKRETARKWLMHGTFHNLHVCVYITYHNITFFGNLSVFPWPTLFLCVCTHIYRPRGFWPKSARFELDLFWGYLMGYWFNYSFRSRSPYWPKLVIESLVQLLSYQVNCWTEKYMYLYKCS